MVRIQSIAPDEAASHSGWESIVNQVAAGIPMAWELVYRSLAPLRFEIAGRIGRDHADDVYHDTIVALVDAIRKGQLHAPEALPAFARTVAVRKVCLFLREAVLARVAVDPDSVTVRDRSPNPEQQRMRAEKREIVARILVSMPACPREVLSRFYFNHESAAEIQRAMQLSATQFRLIKSRAKAFLAERGRAYIARNRER